MHIRASLQFSKNFDRLIISCYCVTAMNNLGQRPQLIEVLFRKHFSIFILKMLTFNIANTISMENMLLFT